MFENKKFLERRALRILALMPHRDAGRTLQEISTRYFKTGALGARSLPILAPLAVLDKPLSRFELSALAAEMRRTTLSGAKDGKIAGLSISPARYSFFPDFQGVFLDLPLPCPDSFKSESIIAWAPQAALCLALLKPGETLDPVVPPPFAFRNAFLVNMLLRFDMQGLLPYSLSWEAGRETWLPPCRRKISDTA